jgi:hypothetical protein
MGILDRFRKAKDTAESVAEQHGDKITDGVHKAADFVDDKTGGKYAGTIDKVENVTDDVVDKLDGEPQQQPAPPAPPAPPA